MGREAVQSGASHVLSMETGQAEAIEPRSSATSAVVQNAAQQLMAANKSQAANESIISNNVEQKATSQLENVKSTQPDPYRSGNRRFSMSLSQGALDNFLSVVDLPDDIAEA